MATIAEKKRFSKLEETLEIEFKNIDLLIQALTHSSYINDKKLPSIQDNERMEFLGDAILKFVMTEKLYNNNPLDKEGVLSKQLSILISDQLLAIKAKELNIGKYIILGQNKQKKKKNITDSLLADALEAIFAAVYLDQGIAKTKKLILSLISPIIPKIDELHDLKDYKTSLQEYTQNLGLGVPKYIILKEKGPDHNKTFIIKTELYIHGKTYIGTGEGNSKKSAAQEAARSILNKLKISV